MPATRVRYADTTRCPDCGSALPPQPDHCPACRLPVQGPLAVSLLETLRAADRLLAELRASAPPQPAPAPAPSPAAYPTAPATPTLPAGHGVRAASVPKILLGLGATCLLVAAGIFLAVAWTWLGIGGRTAVLVVLTLATAGTGQWLSRRGLTVAAEALTTVSLGLLVLDVIGADDAGWIGTDDLTGLAIVIGVCLTAAALALTLGQKRLIVPQLAAPLGLAVLMTATAAELERPQLVSAVAVLAFAGLVAFGRTLGAAVLPWTAGAGAALAWAVLGLQALADAADHPTLRGLWVDRHGWGLVAGAALVLLPLALDRSGALRQACVAFSASTLTVVIALPALDEGMTRATAAAVVATVVWAAVAAAAPNGWYAVPRVPLLGSALLPAVVAAALTLDAATTLLAVGPPYAEPVGVRLDPGSLFAEPTLLPVSVAALVLAALLAVPRSRSLVWPAAVAGATGVATLALFPVPLWTVAASLCLGATILLGDALRRTDRTGTLESAIGGTALAAATVVALPSEHLTSAVLAVALVAALAVLLRGRFAGADECAGLVLPVVVAGLLWSVGEVAGTDPALRAGPILVVLGLAAIARPRLEVEGSAAVAAVLAAGTAVLAASDVSVSLAIHLTVAGVLVTASALVNPDRRWLGWLGGLLLAAATWVRLADIGVEAPEPYTLPSAVALLLVGLHRLHAAPGTATMAALGPGLVLGTVPSLLWVLDEPVSLRAALLGAGCLVLLLGGVQLRWSAPVLVGAVVGGLVVVREAAPYAAEMPQWVLIGLAGAVLIGVGVTWEARLRDLQLAAAYVGRLR